MPNTFFPIWTAAEKTPDPCASRHGGNPQSVAAFERIEPDLKRQRAEVLAYVRQCGRAGCTVREFARYMRHPEALNKYSGRFAELKRDGLIRENGEKREGCGVVVFAEG